MSKNLVVKFRSFWRTLSPVERKRMWDIFTALRGEDGGGETVKYRTTARIRGLLLGKRIRDEAGSQVTFGFFKSDPFDDMTRTNVELFESSKPHFQHHIYGALKALKPYVKKEKFKDLLRFMG